MIKEKEINKLLEPPNDLTEKEREYWVEFVEILGNTNYKKTLADVELVRQYIQHKIMRDMAWQEWNKKPERYIRIVTGVCPDGATPKIVVKENEHYRILNDCNKYMEKLLNDLKLTPVKRLY